MMPRPYAKRCRGSQSTRSHTSSSSSAPARRINGLNITKYKPGLISISAEAISGPGRRARHPSAMARQLLPLCSCLGILLAAQLVTGSIQKGASVSVRARWQGTPYLLEAAEFLADEAPQLYWQFLDSLQLDPALQGSSACWHSLVNQTSQLCLPQVAKILPVVLGVRQYSARLEMFRQLTKQLYPAAQEHCCFVDVDGTIVTEAAKLPAAIKQATDCRQNPRQGCNYTQLQEADHVFNPDHRDMPGAVVGVLHGAPGTDCWSALHTALRDTVDNAPESAPVVYAHRPVLSASCKAVHPCASLGTEEQLVLPGYGVEAVLKNMEYSAMDDKSKADASAAAAKKAASGGAVAGVDLADLGEVKGFKFDVLAQRKPELVQELMTFRDVLMSSDEEETIKVWEVKDAGLQAASRVAAAADPLRLLAEISQNFPSIVSSLTRQQVPDTLRAQVQANQRMISPGANFVMLNGMLMEVKNFELYSFLDRLRIELRLSGQLQGLGLDKGLVNRLLATRVEDNAEGLSDLRLDLSPMRQVLWLNNPEKDKQYQHLSSNIRMLLNMYPGRLAPMALNMMTVVAIGNPLSPECAAFPDIYRRVHSRLFPVRMGMLPVVPEAVARAQARRDNPGKTVDMPTWKDMSIVEKFTRAMLTIRSAFGAEPAYKFWYSLAAQAAKLNNAKAKDAESMLSNEFTEAWKAAAKAAATNKAKVAAKKAPAAAWKDLQNGSGYSSEVGMQLADISNYLIVKGLAHLPKPAWWMNGLLNQITDPAAVDQEIGYAMMLEMQTMQEHVYFDRIDGEEPIVESLLDLTVSVGRWNPSVLGVEDDADSSKMVLVDAYKHPAAKNLTYLHYKSTASRVKPVTHWVVTDLSNKHGRSLAAAAVEFVLNPNGELEPASSRVALILAPGGDPTILDIAVVSAQQQFAEDPQLLKLLSLMLQEEGLDGALSKLGDKHQQKLQELAKEAGLVGAGTWKLEAEQVVAAEASISAMKDLVTSQLQLPLGSGVVVTNGRLLWALNPGDDSTGPALVAEDFELLQLYAENFQAGGALAKVIKAARSDKSSPVKLTAAAGSDVVMVAASALAAQVYPDSRFGSLAAKQIDEVIGSLRGKSISVGPPKEQTELQMTAILNPLTREAQRISQVLLLLQDVINPSVSMFLNPQADLSELPLKSFYRYALPEFNRDEEGRIGLPGAPLAYFNRLPLKRVLTLNLELPESWLVEPTMALHDFDNLRLADVPEQVAYAEYELEAIMLTGSCSEVAEGAKARSKVPPPNGLQLHLGTPAQPHQVDTLVMKNLGYFQLKSSPGLWQLSIAPGRSQDLYRMVSSVDGSSLDAHWGYGWGSKKSSSSSSSSQGSAATTQVTETTAPVLLQSFTGKHLNLKVQKRPGKENLSLLEVDGKDAGSSKQSSSSSLSKPSDKDNVINVFTVASGHMYERLQKIMILSVIKNTKSRVKFWIIKNYMSPHHKRIIPEMAKHYNFDYEFVTYKWPHWLHKQTDKQRIIWAYKILFLDVLFPLDVPRMIFVDSDQVVRTDLAELYNMDLKGAPMAYTPFCDNNKEMDPYRFWKTGFWETHLQGKPYHISALYLIDLVRLRQLAAGDQYRVIYDNLSKDPNSLANLDQDLPNYAQHSIPIYSLPQEWLWCESWCGKETQPQARTIDLCNNPKTKEPKLSAARRIIKEWPDLDAEQAAFTASIDEKYKAQEAAFAAAGAAVDADAAGTAADADTMGSCSRGDGSCSATDSDLEATDHSEL